MYIYHDIYALHSVTLHCRQTTGDDEIETIICIVIVYSACIDHCCSWMTITFECCYNGVCMYMQMSVLRILSRYMMCVQICPCISDMRIICRVKMRILIEKENN